MRVASQASTNTSWRRRRERGDDVDRRARSAVQLMQMGECSAVREPRMLRWLQVARTLSDSCETDDDGHHFSVHFCRIVACPAQGHFILDDKFFLQSWLVLVAEPHWDLKG